LTNFQLKLSRTVLNFGFNYLLRQLRDCEVVNTEQWKNPCVVQQHRVRFESLGFSCINFNVLDYKRFFPSTEAVFNLPVVFQASFVRGVTCHLATKMPETAVTLAFDGELFGV
jgi:hypothetical protein